MYFYHRDMFKRPPNQPPPTPQGAAATATATAVTAAAGPRHRVSSPGIFFFFSPFYSYYLSITSTYQHIKNMSSHQTDGSGRPAPAPAPSLALFTRGGGILFLYLVI
jgi:hypothetical protein